MRLGDLLVESGVLSAADLERGLEMQRATRARLGSTLTEMGALTTDEVARALARQHGVPAALDRHILGRDRALVGRVPADVAQGVWALPVALSRGGDGLSLVVCLRDPTPDSIAAVTSATRLPVIPSVACERVLRRELDLSYPRRAGAERTPASAPAPAPVDDGSIDIDIEEASQPFPQIGELGELSLVGLDDQYVNKDHSQNTSVGSGPIPTVPARGDRRTASNPAIRLADLAPPRRLEDAVTAIAGAGSADEVGDIAVSYLRGPWKAGLVMAVKEKMALGQVGFGGGVTPAVVESIVVPLDQPSVLRTAHDDRRPFTGDAATGSTAQERFLRLFAEVGSRTVAVAPVMVRDRPVSLIFAIGPSAPLPEASSGVAVLAHAMGDAFRRIILAAKKR